MKMLFHCTRFYISMFIVFTFCQVLESRRSIRIQPAQEKGHIIIKEGEELFLWYKSYTKLKFLYPVDLEKPNNTSKYSIYYEMKDDTYNYKFMKPITIYRDTDSYGYDVYDSFDPSTNSPISGLDLLYVYVKSDKHLFVEADTNANLSATAGSGVVIPCRVTSPYLKPILTKSNGDVLNEMHYNPMMGFIIENLSLEDSDSYKCSIEKNNTKHTVSYALSVVKESLPEPKIQVNNFITRGQDLKINCIVQMESLIECKFNWNMLQKNSGRTHIQQFTQRLNGNVLVTSQLTIFNVTIEDSGNYECIISSMYDIKRIKKNIKIHDPQIELIELIPEFNTSYYQVQSGGMILWYVGIRTPVELTLQWLKPNGKKLYSNFRFITIYEKYNSSGFNSTLVEKFLNLKMETLVQMFSLKITNSGNYTLEAEKNNIIKKINFTLDVIGKPISILRNGSNYILNKTTEFRCMIISNPPPNVTWSFLKCPNYPSVENSTIVHLTNATQSTIENSNYKFESIVKMPIEMSGKITCEACNNFGCNSKTENITASVPVPPFFSKTNMNHTKTKIVDVTESQNISVILRCFAKGMPEPTLTWYKDNVMLEENDQYFFQHNRQKLHIKYLKLYDSGNYSCRANNSVGTNETYQQITVKDTKWNTFDIVLVTSLPILGFILIILAIHFTIKIYREEQVKKELMEAGLINFEEGTLESINPNLTVDEQAELLPYDKKWEFPRERLKLKEQLDSGQFGVVMKAEAIRICKYESVTTVAVKMVRRTTNSIYIRALVSELKIMVHLGKHLNIINLLGACTKNISKCELLVIVEYCHFGNLRNYLLKHRNHFINQFDSKTGKFDFTKRMDQLTTTVNVNNDSLNENSDTDIMVLCCPETNRDPSEVNLLSDCVVNSNSCQSEERSKEERSEERSNHCDKDENLKPIYTQDLLSWAFQVACGMEYLSQRKVLHGDLAARNILLTEHNIVKICDFGLAKTIYQCGNYKKKSDVPVPLKWMAIESIRDQVFSTQSDVWSFGVMLWEFFTLAETPYPGMEPKELYQKLIEGYRMEQPDYATREIYDIMLQCWEAMPTFRPSFTDLMESIGNLLEENVRLHYIILNNPYMDMNRMNLENKNDYLMMMSTPDHVVL